jgi:hypothetical protein
MIHGPGSRAGTDLLNLVSQKVADGLAPPKYNGHVFTV